MDEYFQQIEYEYNKENKFKDQEYSIKDIEFNNSEDNERYMEQTVKNYCQDKQLYEEDVPQPDLEFIQHNLECDINELQTEEKRQKQLKTILSNKKSQNLQTKKKIASAYQMSIKLFNNNNNNIVQNDEKIIHYISTCNLIQVVKFFQNNPNYFDSPKNKGNYFLHLACKFGYIILVRYLINKGIDIDQEYKGQTALEISVFLNHIKIIDLLLLNGAQYNYIDKKKLNNEISIIFKKYDDLYKIPYSYKNKQQQQTQPILQFIQDQRKEKNILSANLLYLPGSNIEIGYFCQINYNQNNYPEQYKKFKQVINEPDKWVRFYHGTFMEFASPIIKNGLLKPSTRNVQPREGHIPIYKTIQGVKNFADAIFLSPSLFTATNKAYAENININDNNKTQYYFVLQVSAHVDHFKYFTSTLLNYQFRPDEPSLQEARIENEQFVVVTGIYFVKQTYIDQINLRHQQARSQFNQQPVMKGIMATEKNTMQLKINYASLCLAGHLLKNQQDTQQQFQCDACGNEANQNDDYVMGICDKCEFRRCYDCQYKEKLL